VVPVQNLTSCTVPPISTLAAKAACDTCGRNCFCATWLSSNPGSTGQPDGDVRYLEIPFRRSRINRNRERRKNEGGLERFVALKVPEHCPLVLLIKLRSSEGKKFGSKDSKVKGSGLFAVGL
jgi:hypothetical protein